MTRAILLLFCISVFTISIHAQNGKEKVLVTDLLKVKSLSNLTLTQDGSRAAFTVTSIEPEADNRWEYKYVTNIWMTTTDANAVPRQITGKEGSSQPAWSPDGKQLAFVRAAEGKPQIWLLSMDGGEAIQLTKFKYGATAPKWSPDGKLLLFRTNVSLTQILKDEELNPGLRTPSWPSEKPGLKANEAMKSSTAKANPDGSIEEVRAYLENNVSDKKAKVLTKLNFQEEASVSSEMSFSHTYIVDPKTGTNPIAITKGFYSYGNGSFTPDGKQLIIPVSLDSTEHPDRSSDAGLYSVGTDGKGLRKLLGEKSKAFASPAVSPTGKFVAMQISVPLSINVPVLSIMPINGTASDIVEIPMDRTKGQLIWSKDEKYIYFSAQSNGGAPLYRSDLKTRQVEQLTDYNGGISSFDLANNKLIYVRTDINSPFEIYVADAAGKNAKRISNFNTEWIKEKKLSIPEKHEFVNEKGMKVEYWVMKPTSFEAGKKYPLLLEIHGGPAAMWGPGESSMWHEYQYFCSQGYGVVYSNPRGSGGYGVDFLKGNVNDWGTGPAKDVLDALDKTVAEGWADTSKLVLTGGSYAGYLVAWIIAHDNRFKAACSQRGVYDLGTFFGEGNAWRLVPGYFGGYPWQENVKKILQRESPITYVEKIQTPYIIFHGENDLRTGVIQGEMLYRSLKVLGRPVEYVRHPGGTHELTRSGNNRQRIDQMLRTWEFFARYISVK
ncbi:MAG: S9 family peptidase [Gemmatimonadaceae bacterium]|nr:S9 family peptidase [Chitinophagaceae bacterium]